VIIAIATAKIEMNIFTLDKILVLFRSHLYAGMMYKNIFTNAVFTFISNYSTKTISGLIIKPLNSAKIAS
jgi:hypothetical protein